MEQKRLPKFAERFSLLRIERGESQNDFAEFLGISRPTVGFYENGTRLPDAAVLGDIAKKCNVSADWLIGIRDERTPDCTVQVICDYTNLTEQAVNILHERSIFPKAAIWAGAFSQISDSLSDLSYWEIMNDCALLVKRSEAELDNYERGIMPTFGKILLNGDLSVNISGLKALEYDLIRISDNFKDDLKHRSGISILTKLAWEQLAQSYSENISDELEGGKHGSTEE